MPIDTTIFGLRFGSSGELMPTQEDLKAFLKSPKMRGGREQRGHDTDRYSELLQNLRSFDQRWREKEDSPGLREAMFYFVLDHSCFVNSALKSAVEQYQYHLHALTTLDFKKPTAFITAAEEEMSSLNPKKKEDAAKLSRLRVMVEDRSRMIEALRKHRDTLTGELSHIAQYVRDNLVKIEKLCETAIVVLVNVQIGGREEGRMIAEVREHFEEHLRDYRQHGPIPREYLENVRNTLEGLTKEISRFFREDVYALAGLYEAIHDHAQKAARELDALLAQSKNKKEKGAEDDAGLYVRGEGVLVSLVSDFRFELKTAESPADSTSKDLLREKRRDMLERLFDLLQKERRARSDRRSSAERRRSRDPRFKGPEQRTGKERRTGKSRRTR
jgi:hypothetical protein